MPNRTVKNQVGNAEAEEVESLRHQKEIAEINLVAVDEELEKLEETRNILEQKLDVKNQEYIAKGGDIVTQRQELYQNMEQEVNQLDSYLSVDINEKAQTVLSGIHQSYRK